MQAGPRQQAAGSGDQASMSWDSVIRFYRFVLRSGDTGLAERLTRALGSDPALRGRVESELRALSRRELTAPAAPDWVLRALLARLAALAP